MKLTLIVDIYIYTFQVHVQIKYACKKERTILKLNIKSDTNLKIKKIKKLLAYTYET